MQLKQISNTLFAIAFLCAVPMLLGKTYGYRTLIHTIFFISGAIALVLSLVAARSEQVRQEFNIVFWIGNLLAFIGLIMKTYYLPYHDFVALGGVVISGISFFYNPFRRERGHDDELLDRMK